MKRVFEEISDDEWENHSFKPSRVLSSNSEARPPPIESFAYRSSPKLEVSDHSSDDCVETKENLEDDDADVELVRPANRGRRFVVEDEDSEGDFAEVCEVKSSTSEEEEDDGDVDEDDVVGKALQKCAKISTELKKELYGSSGTVCDRYSEVEASSVRIVTQVPSIELLIGILL